MLVYLVRNKVTGQEYVGATKGTLDERIARHLIAAFGDKRPNPLYVALRKYGMANFSFDVVADVFDTPEALWAREREEIAARNCMVPNGYNQSAGQGDWWKGRKRGPMSEEQRRLRSIAGKGRRAWNKGVPHTYKTRLKMRGRKAWNKGVPRTEQEKENMRAAIAASRAHGNQHPRAKAIRCDGVEYPSVREMQRQTGMSRGGIYYRLANGRATFVERVKETDASRNGSDDVPERG